MNNFKQFFKESKQAWSIRCLYLHHYYSLLISTYYSIWKLTRSISLCCWSVFLTSINKIHNNKHDLSYGTYLRGNMGIKGTQGQYRSDNNVLRYRRGEREGTVRVIYIPHLISGWYTRARSYRHAHHRLVQINAIQTAWIYSFIGTICNTSNSAVAVVS